MKSLTRIFCVAVFVLAICLPALSQERGRPESSGGDRNAGRDTPGMSSAGTASIASRGIASSTGSYSTSTTSTTSRDMYSSSGSYISGATGSYSSYVPDLRGTSFATANTYWHWQDFLRELRFHYMLSDRYFSRFYRNSEPLVTPLLLRLTLREPLALSARMLLAVDVLQLMLSDVEAGKPVSQQVIAAKAQEIRDLAKQIRQNQSLTFFDQRKSKDLFKGVKLNDLGLEVMEQLRELITDLNTQLVELSKENSTATISVTSLTQPSFESLSKGIEKLTKVIENSTRRM